MSDELTNSGAAPVSTDNPVTTDPSATAAAPAVNPDAPVSGEPTADNPAPAPKPDAALMERLEAMGKNFKELQGFSTRTTQENAALRKQLAQLHQAQQEMAATLAKAFQKPHDPDAFLEDLRTGGDTFLKSRLDELLKTGREQDAEKFSALQTELAELRYDRERERRRGDKEKYPDYEKLEEEMAAAAKDAATPVDFSQPIGTVLDALYEFVRLKHSKEALLAATKAGREDADAAARREAATTVAGGGKNAGPTQPKLEAMSADQLRELAISRGMVSDS